MPLPVKKEHFPCGPEKATVNPPVWSQHYPVLVGSGKGTVVHYVRIRYDAAAGGARTASVKKVPDGSAFSVAGTTVSGPGSSTATSTAAGAVVDMNTTVSTLYEWLIDPANNVLKDKEVLVISMNGSLLSVAGVVVEIGYSPLTN